MNENIREQITTALKRWEDSRAYSVNVIDHYEAANGMRDTLQRVQASAGLILTPEALSLLSTVLDFHDDDTELSEESGESLETVTELRTAVAEAIRNQ